MHVTLQVVDGYFVHYFAPGSLPAVPKNVVFVIDVSGSMQGHKMTQTKQAMVAIAAVWIAMVIPKIAVETARSTTPGAMFPIPTWPAN